LPRGFHRIAIVHRSGGDNLHDADAVPAPVRQARLFQLPRVEARGGTENERRRGETSAAMREFARRHLDQDLATFSAAYEDLFVRLAGDAFSDRLRATRRILTGSNPPPGSDQWLLHDDDFDAPQAIRRFTRRAWRRPIGEAEHERLMALFRRGIDRGESPRQAVKLPLKAVLVSPHFLFISEQAPAHPGIVSITDLELASRLSFFLWHSIPDETLLSLAEAGRLLDPEVLKAQVDRMIAHASSKRFAKAFAGQWLGTAAVGNTKIPDVNFFRPAYNPAVVNSLREQAGAMMHHLLTENRPLTDWLQSDYVIVNETLAYHYALGGDQDGGDAEKVYDRWRGSEHAVEIDPFFKVGVPPESPDRHRVGVLGMGGVHLLTSYSRRTSPVLRGGWVLETLLGVRVPQPPPDAGQLPGGEKEQKGKTVRERLQAHRDNPTCAACHDLIDPIGFALESFDVLGRYRRTEADSDEPIDTRGRLPGGETFDDVDDLRGVLLGRRDDFVAEHVRRMLGYALARSLEEADSCTLDALIKTIRSGRNGTADLVHAIISSVPFRNRQARSLP